ncbi:MAG: hypothetical protein ACXVGH_05900 [Mycobacteriales bacterium]
MHQFLRARALSLAVVVAVAGAVVSVPVHADASSILKIHINSHGKVRLSDTTLHTGTVRFALTGGAPGWGVQVVTLKHGLTLKRAEGLVAGAFAGNVKKIRKMYADINFVGGPSASGPTSGTLELPKAGTYYVFGTPPDGVKSPNVVKVHVTGPAVRPAAPTSKAQVVAVTGARWGGPSTLPHKGTLVFKNRSKDYAHFVDFEAVQPGTTRDQVLSFLQSSGPNSPPPSFADMTRQGFSGSIVSPGEWTAQRFHLAPGAYAVLCFMPDKKMGMPHALMGMVKIVTVK